MDIVVIVINNTITFLPSIKYKPKERLFRVHIYNKRTKLTSHSNKNLIFYTLHYRNLSILVPKSLTVAKGCLVLLKLLVVVGADFGQVDN